MQLIISYIKFCSCPLQFLKHRPIHLDMEKQASKKKNKKQQKKTPLILMPLIIHSVKSYENECSTERKKNVLIGTNWDETEPLLSSANLRSFSACCLPGFTSS